MNRRCFLRTAGGSIVVAACRPRRAHAQSATAQSWRTFEITTRVEVLEPRGTTRVWLPTALLGSTPYQRTIANEFTAPNGTASLIQRRDDSLGMIVAEFPARATPVVTLISRVATTDHEMRAPTASRTSPRPPGLNHFLRPTKLIPTDGIVRDAAVEITRHARADREKALAIYEWIVEHTFRDAGTRGCGLGDIRFMLQTRSLGGKCADLNALFVGLARAAGLPARDVYGLRVAPSKLGYVSLGVSPSNVTKAQHCRAEVYLDGFGWFPVDPADVRKVVLEEPPGKRPLDDELVMKARRRLFGSWEMNWMAYNFAHDVALPGSAGATLPFFMYPQAEMAGTRIDPLEPERFRYEISSRELG